MTEYPLGTRTKYKINVTSVQSANFYITVYKINFVGVTHMHLEPKSILTL